MANVKYDETNCSDLAKSLKVSTATVHAWCRKGFINAQDISERESKRPRYLIPDSEVNRVTKLVRAYGKRNWLLYNEENRSTQLVKQEETQETVSIDEIYKAFGQERPMGESYFNKPSEDETETLVEPIVKAGDDGSTLVMKEVMNAIQKIQDIKEELENLEARKNQLVAEHGYYRDIVNKWMN